MESARDEEKKGTAETRHLPLQNVTAHVLRGDGTVGRGREIERQTEREREREKKTKREREREVEGGKLPSLKV